MVPRLRGALLRSSAMSSNQCGGKEEERGRVYPDKEAAVERLLQPPGYMRGRPLKIILNSLDIRFPSTESHYQVIQLRRSLFAKVLSSLWREQLVRWKMQPGLSSPETRGWSLFLSFDLELIVKTSKSPLQRPDQVDFASARPVELGGPALPHRRGHLPSPYNRGL